MKRSKFIWVVKKNKESGKADGILLVNYALRKTMLRINPPIKYVAYTGIQMHVVAQT